MVNVKQHTRRTKKGKATQVRSHSRKYLIARYTSRQSFGGKAEVISENSDKKLLSYGTEVANIKNKKAHVLGRFSQTTMRHIKEFLKQNGFFADTSEQIIKDYGVKK